MVTLATPKTTLPTETEIITQKMAELHTLSNPTNKANWPKTVTGLGQLLSARSYSLIGVKFEGSDVTAL